MVINGYECKILISTLTEFLNLCQGGMNAFMCLGIMLEYNYSLVE